ncbi:uncharacterized protein FYN16_013215 isoform 3-T6 [Cariama cristata]
MEALITNLELCSKADGYRTAAFPTLRRLGVSGVVTIWSSVSKHVRQELLQRKAVSVTGLGTFHIQKWRSSEDGEVLTFQRPVFSLSRAVAQIRQLKAASVPVPSEMKQVSVSCKKICSDIPYSEKVVQSCMQETLSFFYFVLRSQEDTDFILKGVGTLTIRGTQVTMAFCEAFLLSVSESRSMVEKLLAKKWVVSDKEVGLSPSRFGHVHQFPQLLPQGAGTEGRQHKETPSERPELPLPASEEHRQTGRKGRCVFGLKGGREPEACLAKRKEKEENRKAGRVTLPELPQRQGGRQGDKMRRAQLPQQEEGSLRFPEITSSREEGVQKAKARIQVRRQLRTELGSLGDTEKWLRQKPSVSNEEARRCQRIKAGRADGRAAVKSAVTDSLDRSPPKSSQPWKKGSIPLVCAPYPQALVTLHNLLHKKKLRMVDVFKKAGMNGRKIKRADFIKVIKETKVPVSDRDLEDAVIFLTSSKPGNFISPEDLIECEKQWLEIRRGESQETQRGVEAEFQKATCKSASCPPSAGGRAKGMKPHAPSKPDGKLIHLEVPPVNTEPERRHLSYDEMEEAGKIFRERRRWAKNKDSPIEWKEKCRMVRSGDACIDGHCLPSTVKSRWGELIDEFRRETFLTYLKTVKLCQERNIAISEATLQKALLHPGYRIMKEGEDIRKILQP